ncbi:MAG: MarR family transcriptional regulator for hemolysin [Halioglobus sp.]|jgi:MarR family transcriptional regulator for hemolysin
MPKYKKHELGQTLMLALRDFQQRLDADLQARGIAGIRARHRAVFMHLDRHGASRSVDLANAAGIRAQSMMKIVHELEELALVTRTEDPTDSRAKLIEFTASGQTLIQELTRSTETIWQQYAELLGSRDLEQSLNSLQQLLSLSKQEQDK